MEIFRAITPKKKTINGFLNISEEQENKEISSDRILTEDCFGCMESLWIVVSPKLKWNEGNYDK